MTGWSGWSGWSGWLDGWWVGWEGPPTGISFAEDFDGRGALGLADFLVALLERVRLEALPRQTAAQKVHEHVAQRLQIVPPTLLCGPKKRKKNNQKTIETSTVSPHTPVPETTPQSVELGLGRPGTRSSQSESAFGFRW